MMSKLQKIPLLMYHALTDVTVAQLNPVHITTGMFEKQMAWLSANGYRTITIEEMLSRFEKKEDAGKTCVISFDDGYSSLYKYATPLLKKYDFNATLFLTAAIVEQPDFNNMQGVDPMSIPAGERPLTWAEVKEMIHNGWSVQSHSISHSDHNIIGFAQLKYEIIESKKIIEQQTGKAVLHYAFPFGKYNTASLKILKEAGYLSAATVHPGLCSSRNDAYRIPRLEMNCHDSLASFEKKITKGYSSSKEKLRSSVRDIIFNNPRVKDISKKIAGKRINFICL